MYLFLFVLYLLDVNDTLRVEDEFGVVKWDYVVILIVKNHELLLLLKKQTKKKGFHEKIA